MRRLSVAALAAAVLVAFAGAGAARSARQERLTASGAGDATLRFASPVRVATSPARLSAVSSTWCGTSALTDLRDQVVPGRSIHFVYVYPADGANRLTEFGTIMQTDAETIDAWWRGQDATRTPRLDTFAFPCGPQLDISELKLPFDGAELTPISGRLQKIVGFLAAAGFDPDFKDYVLYYDGPDDGQGICGQGGGDPNESAGVAIVYVTGCPSEPTAVVAAHELVHALGAVQPPAPNMCAAPNDFHVCDSDRDLMYPFADGTPLTQLVLDVGRNDYYGAAGVGFDVRTSRWLRHLDAAPAHLTIGLTGAGSVASDVPGVACTASCESDWDAGLPVTLVATPATGMRFVRWGGACTGNAECTLTLSGATSVTALFAPQTYLLTVAVVGRGNVFASISASRCQKRCRLSVTSYHSVTLRAVAVSGWRFKRWLGACHALRPVCTLPMTSNAAATAVFAKKTKK